MSDLRQDAVRLLAEWDAWMVSRDPEHDMPSIGPSVDLIRGLLAQLAASEAQREALEKQLREAADQLADAISLLDAEGYATRTKGETVLSIQRVLGGGQVAASEAGSRQE